MAEWLGKALQKPVRGFDSLWYLKKRSTSEGFFVGVGIAFWLGFWAKQEAPVWDPLEKN